MNPYFDADKLGLDILVFDQDDLSYEFDTLIFMATPDGRIYSASDSGCSCPTPFEDYEISDIKQLDEGKFERIGSVEQAKAVFEGWNEYFGTKKTLDRGDLESWVKERLK